MCTAFFFVASSVLLVARCRSGTLSTIVVASVVARLEVVVVVDTGGFDACSAELLVKVGYGNLKLGKVQKGSEELCVGGIAVGGECTFGRSESCN